MEHEWFVESVNKNELDLEFILFNSKNSDLFNFILKHNIKCKNYWLPTKYSIPFYWGWFFFKMVFKKYDFIHCHLFEASLIGLMPAKWLGVKKRIYTRHHSDFHHSYFPHAVKYDLLINKLSTHIIAVSNNIKNILVTMEGVTEKKITTIPHGIPVKIMNQTINQSEVEAKKQKYNLTLNDPIIGVVSRFTEWKGIQFIIPAFEKLLTEFPNAKLVLANAVGEYETQLQILLKKIPEQSYQQIKFESNVIPLFKSFTVFVHAPTSPFYEAFGQVYIESLCFEVPMVCTLSGIASDFIVNEKNAMVVKYKNSEEIYSAVKKLILNKDLREKIVQQGKMDVKEFNFEIKFKKTIELYKCNH